MHLADCTSAAGGKNAMKAENLFKVAVGKYSLKVLNVAERKKYNTTSHNLQIE